MVGNLFQSFLYCKGLQCLLFSAKRLLNEIKYLGRDDMRKENYHRCSEW